MDEIKKELDSQIKEAQEIYELNHESYWMGAVDALKRFMNFVDSLQS